MTGTKHTPGPWAVEYDNDTGPGDEGFWEWYNVGPSKVDVDRFNPAQAKADAALIAAAPDLLAALREFVGAVDAGTTFADASVVEYARAAIAKATNAQP